MSDALGHPGNVLGALSLTIGDQIAAAIASATGQSVSSAAALTALDEFLGQPTVERLAHVLGLTHSGAVRLVDRLAVAGLVSRGAGDDKRTRSIRLTDAGRAAADRVAAARAAVLRQSLSGLDDGERATLDLLLGKVMAGVVEGKDGGAWICRMCDFDACERSEGRCPALNSGLAKYGQAEPDSPAGP